MIQKGNKKIAAACLVGICVLVIIVIVVAVAKGASEEITYRETVAQYGDLVVGVTESASVDVGTVEQTFELNLSALQRAETGSDDTAVNSFGGGMSSAMGAVGGMSSVMGGTGGSGAIMPVSGGSMFGQIFDMVGSSGTDLSDSIGNLTVSEVCISVGQQVEEGDTLYLLEEETVAELEEELQSNVQKAETDLDAVYAEQKVSAQTAQYTYDSSIAYGDYADTEYQTTITTLEAAVTEAQKSLDTANTLLASYEERLALISAEYDEAVKALAECEWGRDNADKWNQTYNYVESVELARSAQSNVDSLAQKKERLEQNTQQAKNNVEECSNALSVAKRELASGKLTAKETLALRELAYHTAQETYDIANAYLEDSATEQEEIFAEAKEKWDEFSSHIDGNAVKAKYSGVITEVTLSVGDTINTNDVLATLYDMADVSMTVSVAEEDMEDIAVGTTANVTITAYPEEVFGATVSEIGDAQTDNSGNVTYDVTITLTGDVSGLYQGMTGDITFITKETREVLYVSNRAILRDGTSSYVKLRDENGRIEKREVVTGFSDGINVEIVEGLSEGDVVLIESKVSES